jgi:hypothetical protein
MFSKFNLSAVNDPRLLSLIFSIVDKSVLRQNLSRGDDHL